MMRMEERSTVELREALGQELTPAAQARRIIQNVCQAFIGKQEAVTQAVLALISGGHVLLEDVPGIGKTLLAKAIAKSIAADFKRIQFTADLLPSDITGVSVLSPLDRQFEFRPGPIFANVLLADEINRSTPRTQSSLLEAMEEQNVTVDGILHPLPSPFFVIATQNPVELEGTYSLPFAQMDRFMVRLSIGYLDRSAEVRMIESQRNLAPLDQIKAVIDCDGLREIQSAVREIRVESALAGYIVDLVQATRAAEELEHGASPRGSLDLQSFSQARALLQGRDYVLPDDIKKSAGLVLSHRLIARRGTRSVSLSARAVIDHIVESVPVPL
jgi:MoxR-like ATPase